MHHWRTRKDKKHSYFDGNDTKEAKQEIKVHLDKMQGTVLQNYKRNRSEWKTQSKQAGRVCAKHRYFLHWRRMMGGDAFYMYKNELSIFFDYFNEHLSSSFVERAVEK